MNFVEKLRNKINNDYPYGYKGNDGNWLIKLCVAETAKEALKRSNKNYECDMPASKDCPGVTCVECVLQYLISECEVNHDR